MVYFGKAGGDINSDPKKIEIVKSLLEEKIKEEPVVFVVSGMRGITDQLITYLHTFGSTIEYFIGSLAKQHRGLGRNLGLNQFDIEDAIERELAELGGNLKYIKKWGLRENKKTADEVISAGERLFIKIFEKYLNENGVYAKAVTGSEIGLKTDDNYGKANILPEAAENVNKFFKDHTAKTKNRVLLVTGFDGTDGEFITTIGRSGSDQTIAFLANALGGEYVELIKSTKGVETADPRVVKIGTKTIKNLSYNLSREAGNIQEDAVKWAREKEIPLHIVYIGDEEHKYGEVKTIVSAKNGSEGYQLIAGVKEAIYLNIDNVRDVPGTGHEIMGILKDNNLNSAMISEGRNSIGFTIDNPTDYNIKAVIKELSEKEFDVKDVEECSLIRGVGDIDDDRHDDFMIAFKMFKKEVGLKNPFSKGAYNRGSYSASITIPRDHYEAAINYMHKKMIIEKFTFSLE